MPTIDIDRDAARDAAQAELDKPIYPKESWTELLSEWIEDLLYRIAQESSTVPGGWVTVGVLLTLLVLAIVVAARIGARTLRTRRPETALFDDRELGAAEHRATAQRHAAAGEWALAIRHRLRAVARQLEETGVLQPVPGRTATELARDASPVAPQLAGALRAAARAFDDVTYGGRPGSDTEYRLVADLDDQLRSSSTVHARSGEPHPAAGDWAEVR
ncbi:DUF4129 domain-containing protein [Mycolicibacterium sp. S2-37]|uniref:DUF4129 domain-containing protein n=1 Tax=Mycolicibacterium sp. S2-37 TaxID=2810297 RepID=UPI001A93C694|nr:DUF4129 domain-containing protein [Mycolicibacterium sp. S2-37]MBO0681020.1 DUF4129 domain-containing protein [Mycolicibacterium sp. S2-37]